MGGLHAVYQELEAKPVPVAAAPKHEGAKLVTPIRLAAVGFGTVVLHPGGRGGVGVVSEGW